MCFKNAAPPPPAAVKGGRSNQQDAWARAKKMGAYEQKLQAEGGGEGAEGNEKEDEEDLDAALTGLRCWPAISVQQCIIGTQADADSTEQTARQEAEERDAQQEEGQGLPQAGTLGAELTEDMQQLHWPNIVSMAMGLTYSSGSSSSGAPPMQDYLYERRIDTSYFVQQVEARVYVVVIAEQWLNQDTPLVQNFLQDMRRNLDNTVVFAKMRMAQSSYAVRD
jgi:hypothetical protein